MSQVTESRASSAAPPNIQDVFLNTARRDRLVVTIHLMDGRYFEARIKNFDKFVVIFDVDGAITWCSSTPSPPSRLRSPDSFSSCRSDRAR